MAEFTGFSAVGDFLGEDDPIEQKEAAAVSTKNEKVVSHGSKRRGVGSAAPTNRQRSELTTRVLKVGQKRGRQDDGDDEDPPAVEDGDDDEEDLGRTAIASESKSAAKIESVVSDAHSSAQKPKKKLGKKERQRMKEEEESKKDKAEASSENPPSQPELLDEADISQQLEDTEPGVISEDTSASKNKKKRRKIRSKQKNVRKDNREKKPSHLRLGYNYQGRPLTEETRKRLGLPEPKSRQISSISAPPPVKDDSIKLGVEDLLDVKPKAPPKKKKKSKYKNLR